MSTGSGFGQETFAGKYQCEPPVLTCYGAEDAGLPLDAVACS